MIIDASVVAKWIFKGEEYRRNSLRIKRMYEENLVRLKAPCLLLYEVGNAIWKRKDIDKETAIKLIKLLSEYIKDILVPVDSRLLKKAMEIARKARITFYDASYIALALLDNDIFVTADEELIKKVKDIVNVKHVSEF